MRVLVGEKRLKFFDGSRCNRPGDDREKETGVVSSSRHGDYWHRHQNSNYIAGPPSSGNSTINFNHSFQPSLSRLLVSSTISPQRPSNPLLLYLTPSPQCSLTIILPFQSRPYRNATAVCTRH